MADLAKVVIPGAQDEYTVHLKDALSEAWDWSVQAAQGKLPGVPTGFIDLDKLLKTMIAGNLYIAAGRPGMGKTAFLLTVALHAAKAGKKVLIFSLEMSRMQVAQRLISQIAQVDLEKVINAEEMDMAEWDRVGKAIEQLEAYGIVINDLSEINIRQIRQTSRKVKAEQGVDLVIVDYLQLAEGDDDKYESRVQEVSKVSRGLKYLARELEVPVLAAAQLNREVEKRADKRPILADLRESGQLEQDAYAIMFLFKANPDTEPNVVTVDVAKHRNGKTGAIELIFRGEFTKFENAATKYFRPNEERN
jgi:replicative DNA helicase